MDGLEDDVEGQATVLRIDFMGSVGRQVASQHDVKVIPALLLFDGNGELLMRQGGFIDADEMRLAIFALSEETP